MRAVVATDYGPPESYVVTQVPVPQADRGQLQVRVEAASINPGDIVIPSGAFREQYPLTFPHVPGNDFAGTVTQVGPDVDGYRIGDAVFGFAAPRAIRAIVGPRPSVGTGSLAEYVVIEAATPLVAHRPPGLDPASAAALATTGLTARALLATAPVRAGWTVLVVGATGGVGTAAVPLYAAAGATVIATATDADAALLRSLGAVHTISYAEKDYPTGVDLAVNLALPGDRLRGLARAVRPGGRLLTITYPVPDTDRIGRDDIDLTFIATLEGRDGGMRAVGELAARGDLKAVVGRRYPLDEGAQACVDFARRHTSGKLVVTI